MAAPVQEVAATPQGGVQHRVLTWLMMIFGTVVPVGTVLAFVPELVRGHEVSHWPWEEYGVLGWWLVPLSLGIATAFAAARPGYARGRGVWWCGMFALLTTGALFFNP